MRLRLPTALTLACALLAPGLAHADQIKYIKRPQEGLAAFTSLANSARQTIDLSTFIFEPCQASAQVLMEILAQKSLAGVHVRLLLDAFLQGASARRNLTAWATKYGIELRWYHSNLIYGIALNHRSHVKLMLVDNDSYISGGRNVADEYFGMAEGPNFLDRDLLVKGASAKDAARSFAELWNSRVATNTQTGGTFTSWAKSCGTDLTPRVNSVKNYLAKNTRALITAIPTRNCSRVDFFTDKTDFLAEKYNGGEKFQDLLSADRLAAKRVTHTVLDFIAGTRARLDMENWSYIPTGRLKRAFAALRDRRVPTTIVTNDDMDGSPIVQHAEEFENSKASERDNTGSEIIMQVSRFGSLNQSYALTPPGATYRLHGKVFTRDDRDVLVGSFNIDPRSYHTNLESLVRVEGCPALAADIKGGVQELTQVFIRDVKSGKLPPPKSSSLLGRITGFLSFHYL